MFKLPTKYDVIIIGSGHAGIEAALAAASLLLGAIPVHASRPAATNGGTLTIGASNDALTLDPTNANYRAMLAEALRYKEGEEHLSAGQKFLKAGRLEEAAEAFERRNFAQEA